MTLSQFEAMIRTYGPAVDKWPKALISPALDLMQTSLAAQDLFAAASVTDLDDEDTPSARTFGDDAVPVETRAYH